MKAQRALVAMLLGTLAFSGQALSAERAKGPGKIDLRILYAGHPNTQREKDFVDFLSKHFTHVATGDLAKFTAASGKGHDVIILDYDGDPFKAPRIRLPRSYARSTVIVGAIGAFISGRMGLKTDYL